MFIHRDRSRSSFRKHFSQALITVLVCASMCQRALADDTTKLDSFVVSVMKEYATPGVALVVVKDGKILAQRGYGVRKFDSKEPVDEHTLFPIASCTKSFTAAVLASLVDEGKLSWDQHVIDTLPEFVLHDLYATRMTTCRDLLAHRTGLPAFTGDMLESFGFDRTQILQRLRYLKPACSFREQANYSNLGYFAAGMTAARAGKSTWEELVRNRLFVPLGMKHSGTSYLDRKKSSNVAEAHFALADSQARVVPWENIDTLGPAGSITSTAADLALWLQMLLNEGKASDKQVLSPTSIRAMFSPAMVAQPGFAEFPPISAQSGFAFTMGWNSYHYQGYEVIEKGGARSGVRSVMVLVPQKKLGIAVLANMNLTPVPEAIRAFLLEAHIAPAKSDLQAQIRAANSAIKKLLTPPPPFAGKVVPASLPPEKFCGAYQNPLYGKIIVQLAEGKLTWKAELSKYGGRLEHVSYNTFLLTHPDGVNMFPSQLTFLIDPDGVPGGFSSEVLGSMDFVKP